MGENLGIKSTETLGCLSQQYVFHFGKWLSNFLGTTSLNITMLTAFLTFQGIKIKIHKIYILWNIDVIISINPRPYRKEILWLGLQNYLKISASFCQGQFLRRKDN